MLVLSRYRNEVIRIGNDVQVMVVDIRGDKVRLGVNAPPNVAVHRQEVYEAIQAEGSAQPESRATHQAAPDMTNDVKALRVALEESLRLQSHYAQLLNQHDGGRRFGFATVEEWVSQLQALGKLDAEKAAS